MSRLCGVQWFWSGLLAGAVAAVAQLAPPPTGPDLAPSPTTIPATQPLPSASQVLERFIEATGGHDAYASIVSRHLEAEYKMADLGVTGQVVLDIRNDGNARQTITIPDLDSFVEGITGDLVWSTSQTVGPRLLSGIEEQSLKQSLSLLSDLSLEAYKTAEVVGIAELNGVPSYKMVLSLKAIESSETRYYDVTSGYLLRRDGVVMTDQGAIAITTRYGDYEDAAPIRMPMKIRQSMSGLSPEQIVTKVQHNVALPDEVFAIPAEVEELVKRRATTQSSRQQRIDFPGRVTSEIGSAGGFE